MDFDPSGWGAVIGAHQRRNAQASIDRFQREQTRELKEQRKKLEVQVQAQAEQARAAESAARSEKERLELEKKRFELEEKELAIKKHREMRVRELRKVMVEVEVDLEAL